MNPQPTAAASGHSTHRVYGLNSRAWRDARQKASVNNGGGSSSSEDMTLQRSNISKAVVMSLSEDAGGFGTVGFHKHKILNLRQLSNQSDELTTIYRGELIPCNSEGEPLNALEVATAKTEGDTTTGNLCGNDAVYTIDPFQIQIVITLSAKGVYANKLHSALYAFGKEAARENAPAIQECIGGISIDELIHTKDELRKLSQKIANGEEMEVSDGVRFDSTNKPEGFYVEVMLLEPSVNENDVVICPPTELNKALATFRPLDDDDYIENGNNESSIYQRVYTSRQFTAEIGPWEKENIKVFRMVALDIQKALVRVEFPEFDEGCKDKTFREVYQLNARLKSGSFATVCRGTHRATGRKIAVKCVLRENLPPNDDAAIYDEVLILSTLKHPLICPLIDFFEERECYFLVMELMSGGDLFDRIGEKRNYNEKDARTLCKKMIESVCFCHENSVAHRDMKPKNLLLIDEDDDCAIKLADFGFATRVYEPRSLTKQCGTPFFIAPEVLLRQPYDQQSDMWSVGVITYLILAGDLPFTGRSQKELFQNIVKGDFSFPEEAWSNISNEAKDLLSKLLVTDPSRRLTSSQAIRSRWMIQRADRLQRNSLLFTSQKLKTFNARMKLKSAMIAVTAMASARLSIRRSSADIMAIESDEYDSDSSTEAEEKFAQVKDDDAVAESRS